MGESLQFLASWFIKIKCGLRMRMQKCWRNFIWNLALNWSFDDISFTFWPGHNYNSFSLLNCMNTHGDGSFWNVIYSSKWFWSISSCKSVQINKPCTAVNWWWRLIESNVASSSNTKNLNVYSTKWFNLFFVIFTKFCNLWSLDFSIRNVYILFRNVNMMEKIVPHIKIVRLRVIMLNWVILIEVKSNNIFER